MRYGSRSMKHRIIHTLIHLLPAGMFLLLGGCAYLADRGRDFGDCWTVAVETGGVNAAVKLGPVATLGLGAQNGQGYGLRSGAFGRYETEEGHLIVVGGQAFLPNETALARGKGFAYTYVLPLWEKEDAEWEADMMEGGNFNHGQFEVAANLLVGFRLGFHVGEIADFFLGWFGVDLLKDDAKATRARRERWAEEEKTLRRIRPPEAQEK